ncbi:MAG: hypothetical protein J2P57_20870 [Acidimicrobiaceae bacterium]|nr:hypothetical protein [Acidimicrobiaceae bacterium]
MTGETDAWDDVLDDGTSAVVRLLDLPILHFNVTTVIDRRRCSDVHLVPLCIAVPTPATKDGP